MLKIRKIDLISSIYIFCIVAAELMGGKTFDIARIGNFNLSGSVAIFLLPITFAINDIIIEAKGKARAQSLVRSGIIVVFLLILYSFLAVSLPPTARFATTEATYDTIFRISIRFSFASLAAFATSEFLDVAIFARLRELLGRKNLWLRTNISNIISQFVDTSVFILLAFYTIDKPVAQNALFVFGLILPYWLLKCLMSIIETPLVYIGAKWLKKGDNEDCNGKNSENSRETKDKRTAC
jgi:uncharacterized integral membrane protein (TIGR00697 family)